MSVLVCGGAGYIGSHCVRALLESKEDVIVVDNLWTGHRCAVPKGVQFYEADIRDVFLMDKIFKSHKIDAVLHFSACAQVAESIEQPLKYFDNNVYGMQVLLKSMVNNNVDRIVFSSTSSVYGEPDHIPITEYDLPNPINPYGESKLIMEKIIKWVGQRHNVRYVSFRYFNVAGAWEDGSIGEYHSNETRLVPLILQVPLKQRGNVTIYGNDYPTPDGTCIRDYVHVCDLVDAHILALNYLRKGGSSDIFNLSNGDGYSVREIIRAAEAVTRTNIPIIIGKRRHGDPARLIASSEKARRVLDWNPSYTHMEDIIATAWKWHSSHPNGYVN